MAQHIKFKGDGGEDREGLICADGRISDSTLCGETLDYDSATSGSHSFTDDPINCPLCIMIIKHCKEIKKEEYNQQNNKDKYENCKAL